MIAYCTIKETGKTWSELPQTIVAGRDWSDIVEQTKNTLNAKERDEARLSDTKGYNNQGYYINKR